MYKLSTAVYIRTKKQLHHPSQQYNFMFTIFLTENKAVLYRTGNPNGDDKSKKEEHPIARGEGSDYSSEYHQQK